MSLRYTDKRHDARGKKDWRRPLRKSRAFDSSCRPHGSCGYCYANRMHATKLAEIDAREQLRALSREEMRP